MPYTPPSSHTPVGSKPQSPALSRSESYSKETQAVGDAVRPRPRCDTPRSSSRDYLQKHRRSPSISDSTSFITQPRDPDSLPKRSETAGESDSQARAPEIGHNLGSSVTPGNPKGTLPDSSQSSSEDEAFEDRGRVRDLENIAELQAAASIIEQHRGSSPNRRPTEATKHARMVLGLPRPRIDLSATTRPRPPLSAEARKISHSRSSTDASAFESFPRNKFDSPSHSVSDNDFEEVDEADIVHKPSLVRKKSGEPVRPVLRPSCVKRRPSSMPGTPTYSKAVHFNNDLEQVRTFLQVDRPLAVSAGTSPVESYESELEFPFGNGSPTSQEPPFEWEIQLTNFPRESTDRSALPIKVERVYLSSDNKILLGSIAVRNIAFHKLVVARFTLDYWKTTSEVKADFDNDVRRTHIADGCDRFVFSIKLEDLANLENKTMFFCVRYNVAGQEFWDNNGSINYQVDFAKKAKPQNGKQGAQGADTSPLSALPRSKPSSSAARPRSFPSKASDDFASSLASPYEFSSFPQPSAQVIGDSPIRFKKSAPELLPDAPGRRTNAAGQAFANRYDFGASLSAAIQAASNVPGDRSGIQLRNEVKSAPAKQLSFVSKSALDPKTITTDSQGPGNVHVSAQTTKDVGTPKASLHMDSAKPSALTTEKPSVQSSSYHELLDRYCFFGSGKPSVQPIKPTQDQNQEQSKKQTQNQNEKHIPSLPESTRDSPEHSSSSSAASTPSPPRTLSPPRKEQIRISNRVSPRSSRSASPATGSHLGSRTSSPVSFGYPYHQAMDNAFFGDAHTMTAIHG